MRKGYYPGRGYPDEFGFYEKLLVRMDTTGNLLSLHNIEFVDPFAHPTYLSVKSTDNITNDHIYLSKMTDFKGHQILMIPLSIAFFMMPTEFFTSNFCMMFLRCDSTVFLLNFSFLAICVVLYSWKISLTISFSRLVRELF